jgi:hypothetical protein
VSSENKFALCADSRPCLGALLLLGRCLGGVWCSSSCFLSSRLHTKGRLESLNVSFMIIDIGFCRAVIQSLDTERADLPLLYCNLFVLSDSDTCEVRGRNV